MTTVGTYNTLDGKGTVGDFADVLLLTEAIPAKVRAQVGKTHDVFVCERQPDLVIAVRRGLLTSVASTNYKKAHWGIPKVTPNRGTFWITGRMGDVKVALLVEHRINAAFAPFKRGEGLFRKTMWEMHTRMTLRIVRRLKKQGHTVYGGGDTNTPRGVSAYRGVLVEAGKGLDRLGSTRRLKGVQVLPRNGSDHHPLKATTGDRT